MTHTQVQNVSTCKVPHAPVVIAWVDAALAETGRTGVELTVRIVDEQEGAELNRRYRHKNFPTNVLSFPFEDPPEVNTNILGDVVICAPLVIKESSEYSVPLNTRWAHMVIHGVLHLCGLDHQTDQDAAAMEAMEMRLLTQLGLVEPLSAANDS
ncbi:MAG: rRNA maturation RNase YbeY [Gammaproteobacteria bacterium]|nr:rRNA maturation RNase YbeY [Gammaproteobacteria bacterium]